MATMKTLYAITALLLIASLMIAGCAKKAEEPVKAPAKETTETETEQDLSELESLDKDLEMGELEGIEKDLEGVDW